jgi:hypothetical protein
LQRSEKPIGQNLVPTLSWPLISRNSGGRFVVRAGRGLTIKLSSARRHHCPLTLPFSFSQFCPLWPAHAKGTAASQRGLDIESHGQKFIPTTPWLIHQAGPEVGGRLPTPAMKARSDRSPPASSSRLRTQSSSRCPRHEWSRSCGEAVPLILAANATQPPPLGSKALQIPRPADTASLASGIFEPDSRELGAWLPWLQWMVPATQTNHFVLPAVITQTFPFQPILSVGKKLKHRNGASSRA